MPTISAFADELGPDPQVQMDVLAEAGIAHIELRGVWNTNVLKLTDAQCAELKTQLGDRGFSVACIASPIGKVRLDEDWPAHFDAYRRAVELAEFFACRYIRIFSYYAPEGRDVADYRGEVLDRLQQQVDYLGDRHVTLALENEKELFGAYPERCVYLLSAIGSKKLVGAFDPANFVNMDVRDVYRTCWLPLRPYTGYFHIKDFKYGEVERAVPAGEGDGQIPETLRDAAADGYDGWLALEPHLGKAEHSSGQTNPELFKRAAAALKRICAEVGWRV